MRARRGFVLVALAALGALLPVACSGSAGTTYSCECDYVTDMDVPGKLDVTVCVPDRGRGDELAAGCVRDLGVGRTEKCVCGMKGEPCKLGMCLQKHQ